VFRKDVTDFSVRREVFYPSRVSHKISSVLKWTAVFVKSLVIDKLERLFHTSLDRNPAPVGKKLGVLRVIPDTLVMQQSCLTLRPVDVTKLRYKTFDKPQSKNVIFPLKSNFVSCAQPINRGIANG